MKPGVPFTLWQVWKGGLFASQVSLEAQGERRFSEIVEIVRYGPGEAGPTGSVKKATFSVGGQSVLCSDSYIRHDFTFTPSISFFVTCQSEDEIRRLAAALSEGGKTLMPLGAYGFSRQFAWVSDRYGVSWQLNLE